MLGRRRNLQMPMAGKEPSTYLRRRYSDDMPRLPSVEGPYMEEKKIESSTLLHSKIQYYIPNIILSLLATVSSFHYQCHCSRYYHQNWNTVHFF
jgi:hypothetical protein